MKKLLSKVYRKLFVNERQERIERKLDEVLYKVDLLFKESNYPKYDYMNMTYNDKSLKPKVLIVGYYGGGSLGDDFMLDSILEKIDRKKYEITVMLAANDLCDVTKYEGVKIIYLPQKIYEIERIGNYYDAVICGGGAILDDLYYLLENYYMTFATALINLLYFFVKNKKTTIIYGLSTNNEYENKDYIKKLKFIVENATYFSLRDSYSKTTLESLGIDTTKVKIVDDLVFALNDLTKKTNIIKNKNYKIMVSLNMQVDNEKKNKEIVVKLLEYLKKANIDQFEINLFPYYTNKNWDFGFFEKIVKEIKDKRVYVGEKAETFEQFLDSFSEYDYVITSRYHVALLSNTLSKKSLLINYDTHRHYINKNKYLYENYNFDKNIIDFSNIDDIKNNFEQLFDNSKTKQVDPKVFISAKKELNEMLNELESSLEKKHEKS